MSGRQYYVYICTGARDSLFTCTIIVCSTTRCIQAGNDCNNVLSSCHVGIRNILAASLDNNSVLGSTQDTQEDGIYLEKVKQIRV